MLIWSYWPGPEGGSERQCHEVVRQLSSRGLDCDVVTSLPGFGVPFRHVEGRTRIVRLGLLAPFSVYSRVVLDKIFSVARSIVCGRSVNRIRIFEQYQQAITFWLMLPMVWLSRVSFLVELALFFFISRPTWNLIHLHEPSWLGGVAVWLSKHGGPPVISQEATCPALPELGYDVPFRLTIDKFRREAVFIAMAQYIEEDLKKKDVRPSRIFRLSNGVHLPADASDVARNTDVVHVGNFSQGSHWKAFDVLVSAWGEVHRISPDARLTLVGGGDYSAWAEYGRRLGCFDSMRFTGYVANPGRYYEISAIFVLPSRVEGMSNALLEAQSYGLACVVSDIPGNLAVVEDGVNGLVVSVGDVEDLARAILRLLRDPDLRSRLGRVAREKAMREYSILSVVERLIKIYHAISIHKDIISI